MLVLAMPAEVRRNFVLPPGVLLQARTAPEPRQASLIQGALPNWENGRPTRTRSAASNHVHHGEAAVGVDAGGGEERRAEIPSEERVAAPAVRGAYTLGLRERVKREAAGAVEPALVAGARERLEEREAVARRAVTEPVPLLVAMAAGVPDQLGAGEHEFLVQVVPGAGEDPRSTGAPLEADPAVTRTTQLSARRAGPVRHTTFADGVPGED